MIGATLASAEATRMERFIVSGISLPEGAGVPRHFLNIHDFSDVRRILHGEEVQHHATTNLQAPEMTIKHLLVFAW